VRVVSPLMAKALTWKAFFEVIESIANYRDPQVEFEAVYLLMPTTQNVDRIMGDFTNGRQQYAAAHLFFIEGLDEPLFQKLTASAAEPFLKELKELFINFWGKRRLGFLDDRYVLIVFLASLGIANVFVMHACVLL
jgi:hypothetical protein